jgi:hypothetical protein
MSDPAEVDKLDGIDVGAFIAAAMREDDEHDPLLESYQKDRRNPWPGEDREPWV